MTSDDLNACAGLVRRGDPDRFLAAMAAPPAARDVLFPLYAFNVEVSRAPWVTQEPAIAEMRLQWWRDALDEIARGDTPRRHEVVTPLSGVLDDPACAVLDRLILARRWDIYRDPFADADAFDTFLDETAGGLMWVAARALGAPDTAEAAIRDIGHAQGLAAWFRAIPALEAAGRVPLVDGRAAAVADLARQGLERLARGRRAQPALPRDARAALLPAWKAGPVLRAVLRDPGRVQGGAAELSGAGARLRLIWAAARGRV
ncbi:Phytoene/squalene synthetase [Lutimaribacter pacificus]|uniref:Phytoene/squalene synthetase n=1 Tax=Lutimaribacter pacificus TaxID=391948 RepID=A0A1H0ALY7_9RHOB|nr:squalene/phytoene synthase family protein [Lutimaribacter pacificus]SDN33836.1 Phytoene/squalene synthetase [Lutimaribacter pacificus]SHJ68149.1 Phytoene/squalene synthetase [Lutimaribacter pacificus]